MRNWSEIAGSWCPQYSRNKHCAKWWFILTPRHRSVSIAYRRSGVAMQRRIRESARASPANLALGHRAVPRLFRQCDRQLEYLVTVIASEVDLNRRRIDVHIPADHLE